MDLSVVNRTQCIEKIHNTFLQKKLDAIFRQSKVNQSECAETFDTDVLLLIHAEIHDHINYAVVNQLLEKDFVICQQ